MAVILSFTNQATLGSTDYFGGVRDDSPDVDSRYSYDNVRNQIADDWGLTGETGATVTWDKTTAFVFQVGSNTELRIDAGGIQLDAGTDIGEFSIDGTLAGDSDNAVPTEKAVKTYVDATAFGAGSLWTNVAGSHQSDAAVNFEMLIGGDTRFQFGDSVGDTVMVMTNCGVAGSAEAIIRATDDSAGVMGSIKIRDFDAFQIESHSGVPIVLEPEGTADAYTFNTATFVGNPTTSYDFKVSNTSRFSLSATQVTGNPTTDWQFDVGGTTILTLDANHGTNGIVTNTEKISLSAADLAALHTTAIVLVADPGVGRFVQLLRVTMHYVFDTAIYNSVVTRIRWAGVTGDSIMEESGLLNLGTSRWFQDVFDRFLSTGDITNNTVVIENDADAGSTGQGTLDVWVTYVILDA